jgi:hypothetical protein
LLRESFSICSEIFQLAMIGKITAAEGHGVQAGAFRPAAADQVQETGPGWL